MSNWPGILSFIRRQDRFWCVCDKRERAVGDGSPFSRIDVEFCNRRHARHAGKLPTPLMGEEPPKLAQADVVSVGALKECLSGIKACHRQFAFADGAD